MLPVRRRPEHAAASDPSTASAARPVISPSAKAAPLPAQNPSVFSRNCADLLQRTNRMSGGAEPTLKTAHRGGSVGEVLAVFLRLGLTSFGGPIAHLGYFHEEFVVRRRWLDEKTYGDLVALSQFLPGPASSKVGIAIGLSRAGYAGALAAWA